MANSLQQPIQRSGPGGFSCTGFLMVSAFLVLASLLASIAVNLHRLNQRLSEVAGVLGGGFALVDRPTNPNELGFGLTSLDVDGRKVEDVYLTSTAVRSNGTPIMEGSGKSRRERATMSSLRAVLVPLPLKSRGD